MIGMPGMLRAIIAMLLLAITGLAQNSGARMDEIVQTFVPTTQFMGSVLVARGDQVLLSKGYGLANVESAVPNNATTKFRLASITKQFTAAAILILEERGKLRVEDKIKTHLPDAPAAWDNVTLFNLLTHTSGIPSVIGVRGDPIGEPLTPVESVALVRGKSLLFPPGQGWSYSNSGYAILGYLIERITGQSYEQFLQENIFAPLGMKDSGYDSDSPSIQNRATGYSAKRTGGPLAKAPFTDMSRPYSAGALYSTVEDLLRWEQGLFGGKLLSKASLDKMTKPFRNDYALGLQIRTVNGHKVIDHSGSLQGFNTWLAYYPDEKITVAVLGNLSGSAPAQIANLMGRLAHGDTFTLVSERKEISLDPQLLSQFAGTYQMSGGSTMLITADTSQLYGKVANQNLMSLFSESETKFFARTTNTLVEFSGNDAQGRPASLILSQDGKNTTAQRLSDAEAKRLADAEADLAQRIREKKPHPQSEAGLRRIIEELRRGQPNYGLMTATMTETLRRQLPLLQSIVKEGGAVQTIALTAVTPNGTDLYTVKVANASWECRVLLGPDNKIDVFGIRVLKD
jgi:CubicO group peptidase (beta-lactamase class C family)